MIGEAMFARITDLKYIEQIGMTHLLNQIVLCFCSVTPPGLCSPRMMDAIRADVLFTTGDLVVIFSVVSFH